ncbi:MAG: zinc-ribbon domain-containing protein, partial [Myxococcales bacterium]|nr:zinc-ribbon domain-containing protein [Myxococcales bacterium]
MNVPCPKCKVEFAAPDELLKTGVAKASCPKCSFAFVIRLGDPAQPKQSPAPREPVRLEGVKASADVASAKGTIGTQELRFVPADTYTSIVVDDSLRAEIAAVEKERALDPTTDPEARHLEPSTDVDRPKHIEAVTQVDSVEPEPRVKHIDAVTQVDSVEPEPRVKHIDAVTQVDPLPPPGSPATTRPDPLASAVTESGETQRPAGVAKASCPKCSFAFVIRLGDPAQPK